MNAADILKYGHLTALKAIDGLPDDAWGMGGACGIWSIKNIIAHLASYELVLVDILTSLTSSGTATPMLNSYLVGEGFNDSEVDRRKANTAQEVLAEFNDAHARVMALIVTVPVEMLRQNGTLPWYGMDYSLDDVIVYMYYGHKREHSAQIAAFRDHLR